jgi:hypothetical protein
MQGLDLFQPRSGELALRWRSFIDSNSDEYFSQEGEYSRGIIEARDYGRFSVWLGQIRVDSDAVPKKRVNNAQAKKCNQDQKITLGRTRQVID